MPEQGHRAPLAHGLRKPVRHEGADLGGELAVPGHEHLDVLAHQCDGLDQHVGPLDRDQSAEPDQARSRPCPVRSPGRGRGRCRGPRTEAVGVHPVGHDVDAGGVQADVADREVGDRTARADDPRPPPPRDPALPVQVVQPVASPSAVREQVAGHVVAEPVGDTVQRVDDRGPRQAARQAAPDPAGSAVLQVEHVGCQGAQQPGEAGETGEVALGGRLLVVPGDAGGPTGPAAYVGWRDDVGVDPPAGETDGDLDGVVDRPPTGLGQHLDDPHGPPTVRGRGPSSASRGRTPPSATSSHSGRKNSTRNTASPTKPASAATSR